MQNLYGTKELYQATFGEERSQSQPPDTVEEGSTNSISESARVHAIVSRIQTELAQAQLASATPEELLAIVGLIHKQTQGDDMGLEFAVWFLAMQSKLLLPSDIEMEWAAIGRSESKVASLDDLQSLISKYPQKAPEATQDISVSAADQPAQAPIAAPTVPVRNALDRYTLNDRLEDIERQAVEQVPVLGKFALLGQSTAIYAFPNGGKTLITIAETIGAVREGRINPWDVYYANNDDTTTGLVEKLRIANEYGFNMIAETFQDFQASDLQRILNELIEKGHARGKVLILDTLTKFVNVLDAGKARAFTKPIRKFVLQGGTVIALAHANKNPGADGKPVYRGTTDIINDFDCVYVMSQVQAANNEKVVLLENRKRRGNVPDSVAYSYSTEPGISYAELVSTVKPVDQDQLEAFQKAEALKSDAEVITAVVAAIQSGIDTKMLLADAVADRAGISKRQAIKVIERYTGTDPTQHRWQFSVKERGAKVFELLDTTPPSTDGNTTG